MRFIKVTATNIYSAVFALQKSSGTLHFRFAHPHLTGLMRKPRCTSVSQIARQEVGIFWVA